MGNDQKEAKRDWKSYEEKLKAKKKKLVEFFIRKPTKEELEEELERMNYKGKPGARFEIPETVLCFFHYLKSIFGIDDRTLVLFLSAFLNETLGTEREFSHSAIVKRRAGMNLDVPSGITPEKLNGKRVYFDGMCLRVGRGGYYRSKKYKTEVRYLRIGLFTDDEGKVVDFVIGDEHDAEVNMLREKMPEIEKSKAEAVVVDGAGSTKDIVVGLVQNNIRPLIRASEKVVRSMNTKPPPYDCIKQKKEEELIWENYAKAQQDYERWKMESGYTLRWVFSEGKISSFKRTFGEEVVCRTQKSMHDEICMKFMLLDGLLPKLWG